MRNKTIQRLSEPRLLFSPTAWAKLVYLRDAGNTEIGGFGITTDPTRPCHVAEIALVKQWTTATSVEFDDEAVVNYFEDQVARGLRPQQFGRIWIHTHPAMSAHPTGLDEETFARCFGRADWAIMFILSKTEDTYCRLSCNVGPGLSQEISHGVDWTTPFLGTDHEAWGAEHLACVQPYCRKQPPGVGEHDELFVEQGRLRTEESLSHEAADWLDAWEEYQYARLDELREIRESPR